MVPTAKLRAWAAAAAGIPDWLFEESYHAVGDLAETIALLLPAPLAASDLPLSYWVEERLLTLRGADEAVQREAIRQAWSEMDDRQRFVWNKLITGAFRVGVSQQLVTRAGRSRRHGRSGRGAPADGRLGAIGDLLRALLAPDAGDADASRLYPFFLAHPLSEVPDSLGPIADWQAEWKWDGIRAQFIRRAGQTFVWTRGEELVTERYPELASIGPSLPDGTVIDGEILPWKQGQVLPFAQLQRRIGRKSLGKKLLAEVPVVLMAFDLLEDHGEDVRTRPLTRRRGRLADVVAGVGFGVRHRTLAASASRKLGRPGPGPGREPDAAS